MELTLKIGRSYREKPEPTKPPALGATGRSGTKTMAGRLFEDYKSDLSGRAAVLIYDKMRRSDSQVAMTLRALGLPILQAKWEVQAAVEDEEMGEKIALGVSRMLFAGGSQHWRSVLRHALLMLPFGFSCLEEVWELRERPENMKELGAPEKMYWLKGLEPRLPQSIDQWLGLDTPPYKLTGVQQVIPVGGQNPPPIPVENLVIFTNEKEGDNYEGRALLRSAYKDWYYAALLEKFDAIGLERAAIGLPEIHFDTLEGVTDVEEAITRAQDILMHLNASEEGFIVTMPGQTFNPHLAVYNNDAIRASIRDHKRAISVNALMQFMELGAEGGSGSRATASEQRGPFDLSLLALADEIAETVSHETIEDIVRYNWGERPGYPNLVPSGVLDTDMTDLAAIVEKLVRAGALVPDTDLEDWMRNTLNLPGAVRPKDEEPKQLPAPGKAAPPAPVEMQYQDSDAQPFWREPTTKERHVAFAQIKYDLDRAKIDFLDHVGRAAQEMADSMVDDALRLVRTQDYDRLIALKAPGVAKLVSTIKGELRPLVAYGRQTVRDEHERARAGESAATVIQKRQEGIRGYQGEDLLSDAGLNLWQSLKAKRKAQLIVDAIEAALIDVGLRFIRAAVDNAVALKTLTETATTTVGRSVLNAAGLLIAEGFGMGRGSEIKQELERGLITKGIYSALLDDALCDECAKLDGQEFTPDMPEFDQYMDGNSEGCIGGERCRCLLFLSYGDVEEPAVVDWLPGDEPSIVMPGGGFGL